MEVGPLVAVGCGALGADPSLGITSALGCWRLNQVFSGLERVSYWREPSGGLRG